MPEMRQASDIYGVESWQVPHVAMQGEKKSMGEKDMRRRSTVLKITEKQFQRQILDAARVTGWMCYHTMFSIRSERGFPDLIMIHPVKRRLIAVELKTEKGKTTAAQNLWLHMFGIVETVESYLWRPADFDDAWEVLRK